MRNEFVHPIVVPDEKSKVIAKAEVPERVKNVTKTLKPLVGENVSLAVLEKEMFKHKPILSMNELRDITDPEGKIDFLGKSFPIYIKQGDDWVYPDYTMLINLHLIEDNGGFSENSVVRVNSLKYEGVEETEQGLRRVYVDLCEKSNQVEKEKEQEKEYRRSIKNHDCELEL
ncbi:hypothetical protein [Halobacillus amylolyticus]|uniref:Uncharacterized protein n=1 Tax=Halobacillus amylolyticus TaxID=2932259 RepID=A0ABY4HH25_9BACI|nr:hypothetical protein [Halobacillus amylolyticus]UOR14197.1 hypothetical protein MUO15_21180 [Halobacillus amylolyticus]